MLLKSVIKSTINSWTAQLAQNRTSLNRKTLLQRERIPVFFSFQSPLSFVLGKIFSYLFIYRQVSEMDFNNSHCFYNLMQGWVFNRKQFWLIDWSKSDINHFFKNCIPDMSRSNRSNIDEIFNLDTTKDNNIVSDSLVTSSENSKSVVRFNNQTTTLGYVRGNSSETSHGYTSFWRFNFIWLICFVICMCFIATFLLLTHYYQDFLKDKFSRTLKFSSQGRNWDKKAEHFCKTSILEW